jgi:hypothetical protein
MRCDNRNCHCQSYNGLIPAAGYVRQSETRDGSESIPLQIDIIKAAAPRLGLDLVTILVEPPSTSGYKNRGRDRAKWRELLVLGPDPGRPGL